MRQPTFSYRVKHLMLHQAVWSYSTGGDFVDTTMNTKFICRIKIFSLLDIIVFSWVCSEISVSCKRHISWSESNFQKQLLVLFLLKPQIIAYSDNWYALYLLWIETVLHQKSQWQNIFRVTKLCIYRYVRTYICATFDLQLCLRLGI